MVDSPRVPLAFRVGIVGHRPNRLQRAELDRLGNVIRDVLVIVRDEVEGARGRMPGVFSEAPPVLRAVSALAEGTDRLFAEQALELGFHLCCVTPFPKAEFERDFAPAHAAEEDSLGRFRRLFERAATRFELDGRRTDAGEAYGAGGQVVLNQSDLLIAVWDGEFQGKGQGTEDIVAEARRRHLPVVWIDAHAPHAWEIAGPTTPRPRSNGGRRLAPSRESFEDELRSLVREALDLWETEACAEPSIGEARTQARDCLADYYAERPGGCGAGILWRCFRHVVGGRVGEDPRSASGADGTSDARGDDPGPGGDVRDALHALYAWSDRLAVRYSDRYRSAFILCFLLAATAVGFALLPVAWTGLAHGSHAAHAIEAACAGVELGLILAILAMVYLGRRCRWHERSIDYRLMAEMLRHHRLVVPLGGGRPFPQIPAHWAAYGQPGTTWVAWYVRAIERAFGLPSASVDDGHVRHCLADLGRSLREQIGYHAANARRCGQIERRLHHWGIGTLILTLIACGLHLSPHLLHRPPPPSLSSWLTVLCGFLPAVGAALAGINNQGEFRRIARRSEAMREHLGMMEQQIRALRQRAGADSGPEAQPFSRVAAALADDAARLMVNEVLDWRVVFLDRPLDPPA